MKKPHYLEFKTLSGGKYLFDSNTGTVMVTNEIMEKAIDLFAVMAMEEVGDKLKKEYPPDEVDGIISFIERWDKQFGGFYRDEQLRVAQKEEMDMLQEADIENHLIAGNQYQLTINLTENCNFGCKYCVFSESYDYTRNRTCNNIKLETGIKAMDLFFEMLKPVVRRIPSKSVGISFYGGEPLLMYGTLKKFVEYAKIHSPVSLVFNISTNGYLLNDEMMDFLIENRVTTAISLDGCKENHDRNRVLHNGEGTFDVVMKNIKRFQEKYPDNPRVCLLAVYDFQTDFEANIRFFEEEDLPRLLFINFVSATNTEYHNRYSDEEKLRFQLKTFELLKKYLVFKREGKHVPEYLKLLFELLYAGVFFRPKRDDPRSFLIPYTSTCIPGVKISVRTDGTLDVCERCNSTYPIGHVDTGIDYTAIKKVLHLYNSGLAKECDTCTLNNNCSLCFAVCNRDGNFSLPDNWCEEFHHTFMSSLSQIFSVLEENPTAYDNINFKEQADILYFT